MKAKSILKFLAGICAVAVLSSCSREDITHDPNTPVEGNTTVTFALELPNKNKPDSRSAATRALSYDDENEVKSIDILVFEPGGGKYLYKAVGYQLSTDGSESRKKTFKVNLKEGTFDLMVLANSSAIAGGVLANLGATATTKTKAEIGALLETQIATTDKKWASTTSKTGYRPFPMWGEKNNQLINENTSLTGDANSVKLTRMLSRIDVLVSGAAFELTDVYVYNWNSHGSLVPPAAKWNTTNPLTPKATGPEVPAASVRNAATPLHYTGTEIDALNNKCESEIYLFEAENHTDAAHTAKKDLTDRTCLVIGGKYDGATQPTYYRVDFSKKVGTQWDYLDLLRNHQYIVNITLVSGPGFETPDDAFNSLPVNIEAGVLEWNDGEMGDVVFDGQHVLSVSKGKFDFFRDACSVEEDDNVLKVFTDYQSADAGARSGWYVEKIVDAVTGNSVTWVTATPDNGPADATSKVVLTYEENQTPNDRTAIIRIAAGRLRFPVTVVQKKTPRISISIVDPVTGDPVKELIFFSALNTVPAQQSFKVNWAPQAERVIVSNATLGTQPFPSNAGVAFPDIIPGGTGTKTYNVQPGPIVAADTVGNPFFEKTSKIDFTVSNGMSYESKSLLLRQVNYNLITNKASSYLLDGSTYTLKVRSNASWRIKSIENDAPKQILALKAGENLKVGTTGGCNVSPSGDALTFTVANDRSFWGLLRVTFESTETPKKFEDKTVTLMFALPKVKIVTIGGYTPNAAAYDASEAHRMLKSAANFGLNETSTVYSRGFENIVSYYSSSITAAIASNPDIIIVGYVSEIGTNAYQKALFDYMASGGIVIFFEESYNMSPLMSYFINPSGTGNEVPLSSMQHINDGGAIYKLQNVPGDPIINGPFGNLAGLQWGESYSSTLALLNTALPAEDIVIYSTGQDFSRTGSANSQYITSFRHKDYNFFYAGDGGFLANAIDSPSSQVGWPFLLNGSTQPTPKLNYGYGSTKYSVYNSTMFGNIITWAITQTTP